MIVPFSDPLFLLDNMEMDKVQNLFQNLNFFFDRPGRLRFLTCESVDLHAKGT